jgi:hypothetical protein
LFQGEGDDRKSEVERFEGWRDASEWASATTIDVVDDTQLGSDAVFRRIKDAVGARS